MFGRIFGRGKDDPEQAVCAECGRTLLAGEWTRKVAGSGGEERLICSLCGPDHPLDEDVLEDAAVAQVDSGPVRETLEGFEEPQGEAAMSGELGTRDADTAALRERLALAEAHNEELACEVARLRTAASEPAPAETPQADGVKESLADGEADVVSTEDAEGLAADCSEPGERTWGETPAEFAEEIATPVAEDESQEAEEEPELASSDTDDAPVPAPSFEDTQPLPAVAEADQESAGELGDGPAPEAEIEIVAEVDGETLAATEAEPEFVPAPGEAEVAALALLQRGVDLFNVSGVPRKIAETNEQLGVPTVNAAAEDEPNVAITFMWSMGWYRFHVDTVSGDANMADRGYEEISDLPPNAGVRDDGTVHLAPAQIGLAAAQRVRQDGVAGPAPATGRPLSESESPSVVAQKPPEILSKSLLGQRSDDEPADWEKTKARDFDWDH